jgi:trimethylamine--corrinoid protein Co-methyltransferase
MEAMYSTMSAALSGANLIHDIGYLEDGLCGSFEQLVITNEIVGMIKRYVSGIEVNKISEEHTFKNFKNEMFMPELIDRNVYANWKKNGSKSLEVRVNEKVKEIIETYKPEPIDDNKLGKIEEYMKENVE